MGVLAGFLSALVVYLGLGEAEPSGFPKSPEKFRQKLGVISVFNNVEEVGINSQFFYV